jgi:thioredoxin reductase (NADPH)
MMASPTRTCDCLVVGGGPAGLTAALYLGRFRRHVLVVDTGRSRAAAIPRSHNHPGFTEGISGPTLLRTLRSQAEGYGAKIVAGTVSGIERTADGFVAATTAGDVLAPKILIATGITDKCPDLEVLDQAGVNDAVRYCPICDGFEAIDKRIAVYGPPEHAAAKARFLRAFSPSVTLIPSLPEVAEPIDGGGEFTLASSPAARIAAAAEGIKVDFKDGAALRFDVLYPAMGCHVHSDLAVALGASANEVGCLVVDSKQQTTVEGIYAAGDVVSDLHQLVVAEGHAAIAATAIHNSLPLNPR